MKKILGLLFLLSGTVRGQYHIALHIINEDTHQPISGVSIDIGGLNKMELSRLGMGGNKAGTSDSSGNIFINNLSKGKYTLHITCIGFINREIKIDLPFPGKDTLFITLEPDVEILGNIIVSSSRTNSRIKDLPTRVEVLGTEDMEEESSMHPSNVAMLLSEASGVQTQQTSATSGNVQIRILGLDGKYTQLLKDGFPMYSGFSNGLSIMQIPPLDLRQVELIKGSSSSLYGGDAIAGIIHFISKRPLTGPQWDFLANRTSRKGTDMGSFYASRNKSWGITLLSTFNHQEPVDIHNDGFTVLPGMTAFTINPKLFWYPADSVSLSLALNTSYDDRKGGDLYAIKNGPVASHPYIEKSKTNRNYYQLEYEQHLPGSRLLTIRNSLSLFNREIGIRDYLFSGKQTSSFSEISYLHTWKNHKTISGINFITDQFSENKITDSLIRDYNFITTGIFIQDIWTINKRWIMEMGIRNDYQSRYGNFFLPRISVLYNVSSGWSLRAGGGPGYKAPTIFDAQTEQTGYKNILPIGKMVIAERSAGVNVNLHYNGTLGKEIKLSFDHTFFYTRIENPLLQDTLAGSSSAPVYYYFKNAPEPYTTRGFETSFRLRQDDWAFFAGYTYVDARTGLPSAPHIALAPRHKLVLNLSKEKEKDYRVAIEAFYTGSQYLYDGTRTKNYWVTGLLLEKVIKIATLVLNFENLTDTRQTRFEHIVIPPVTDPGFREIYAPLEGFMANLAIKIKIL